MLKGFKIGFVILFTAIIIVPIVTMDFMGGKYSLTEKRNLAKFPIGRVQKTGELDISRVSVENWISDNIGQRSKFLLLGSGFKYNILNQSTSERVLRGKAGWLFFTLDNNIEIATGEYPLSEDMLKMIAQNQQDISNYYKGIGVDYILMLTPSKVSIYPEYLPMSDKAVSETVVDIVARYLRDSTDVIVYNAKDALLEAKDNGEGELYYKTDTHWNERGSYYAYKGLHQILVDNGILNDEPVEVSFEEYDYRGDLFVMLGCNELSAPEIAPDAIWSANSIELSEGELYERVNSVENQFGNHQGANVFVNDKSKSSKSAQIYGDSQISTKRNIPNLLSEHFYTFVKYSARSVSFQVDNALNPDVVIYSCSERNIGIYMQKGKK